MAIRPGVKRLLRLGAGQPDNEVEDEIRLHLEHRVEQLVARGLTAEQARVEAERRFGAREALYRTAREKERRLRMRDWFDTVRQDAALTLRSFARYPGFTAAVVGTLALGIGATVGIVSIVDGVLLRPLPYAEPSSLVAIVDRITTTNDESMSSPLELAELRQRTSSFSAIAGVEHDAVNLTGDGVPAQLPAQRVSASFFEMLGVRPLLGQTFRAGDEETGAAPVALLGHELWRSHFGGDASVVGRTIQLDGRSTTVLGVMPAGFRFGNFESALWLPLSYDRAHPGRFLHLAARLRDGVTESRAASDLDAAITALAQENPLFFRNLRLDVVPLRTRVVGDARPVLIALAGAVALLLLIACANVANLLLARALRRRRELAVRLSLGAARSRVIRQLLTESLLLSFAGGVLGLLLAGSAVHTVVSRLPSAVALPRAADISIDGRTVLLSMLVTGMTALLFGIAPALVGSRAEESALLLRGGRGNSGGPRIGRARGALVAAQVALVSVLLLGAGLLGRSLWELQHVALGVQTSHVTAATIAHADQRYPANAQTRQFFIALLEDVRTMPGITAAGMVQHLPFTGERSSTGITIEGSGRTGGADIRVIDGDVFGAMGTRLISGRAFGAADDERAPAVFIVNRALAREVGEGSAIGTRISYDWGEVVNGQVVPVRITGEVVGIVEDVRESGPALAAAPALYRPFAQDPWPTMSLVVRAEADDDVVASAISSRIHQLHPEQPVAPRALGTDVAALNARPRMQLFLIGGFALVALLLAGVGLYGTIAYAVDQRRQEIGIRLAVGASPAMVTRLIVRQGLVITAAGLAAGLGIALFALPALRALVFGVRLADPIAIAGTLCFVGLVAAVASAVPARRAARVDPLSALRAE